MSSKLFTKQELQQIEEAVEQAEGKYPIEIVPVFASASSNYPIVPFRVTLIALALGFIGSLALCGIMSYAITPFYIKGLVLAVWVLLCLVLFEFVTPLKRLLLGHERMFIESENKAKQEFYDHGVYSNPDRIGILIYVSFFERTFHILSDNKGRTLFKDEEWKAIAEGMSNGMKSLKPHEAVINCISNCCKAIEDSDIDINLNPPRLLPNNLRVDE